MKAIAVFIFFMPLLTTGQGIDFEHGLTWQQVQEKARKENKMIFMDVYTTWCGPCKYMTSAIFPQEAVGNFFNEHFINVKVQIDSTTDDNEEIQRWYKDASEISDKYNVQGYPTYLYFNPEGKLLHKDMGASEAEKFIAAAKKAINPETQYYVILEKYMAGERSPAFLYRLAIASQDAYDTDNYMKIANEYVETQKDFFTKQNVDFISRFTESSKDVGFNIILQNPKRFDEFLGKGTANRIIVEIIQEEELFPKIFAKKTKTPDWKILSGKINKRFPKYADEAITGAKVMYYQSNENWPKFEEAIMNYMKKYGSNVPVAQLNEFAWTVFEHSADKAYLTEALNWSKRSFADKENPMFIDTYANLLYKLGRNDEAIKWQQKAVALINEGERKDYEKTLEKMKKGEKTWKD